MENQKKTVNLEVKENGIAQVSVRFPSDAQVAAEIKKAQEKGFEGPKSPLLCTIKLSLESGVSIVGIKYVTSDFAGQTRKDGTIAPKGFIRMPSFRMGEKFVDYVTLSKDMAYVVSNVVDAILEKEAATAAEVAPKEAVTEAAEVAEAPVEETVAA